MKFIRSMWEAITANLEAVLMTVCIVTHILCWLHPNEMPVAVIQAPAC